MKTHIIKVESGSNAEKYFIDAFLPICKDEVKCRLGIIFGMDWNEYEITDADYHRCRISLEEESE